MSGETSGTVAMAVKLPTSSAVTTSSTPSYSDRPEEAEICPTNAQYGSRT